jgi:hypothetical protein
VATAEMIDAIFVALDERIGGAPGIRCEVKTPPTTGSDGW